MTRATVSVTTLSPRYRSVLIAFLQLERSGTESLNNASVHTVQPFSTVANENEA